MKKIMRKLEINDIYSDREIFEVFNCSKFKGIRVSKTNKSIVLILKHIGKLEYEDYWEGDILYYTGSGKGDQKIERENKTLAESNENGYTIHLFEVFKEREYTYSGMFELANAPFFIEENTRKVLKFPIRKLNNEEYINSDNLEKLNTSFEKKLRKESSQKIIEKAIKQNKINQEMTMKSNYRKVTRNWYNRSPYISKVAKKMAEGICQKCEKPAPFKDKNGEPYLHVHHIKYLSEGGQDSLDNCIAVCPNCHAQIHEFDEVKEKEKLKKKSLELYNKFRKIHVSTENR